MEGEFPAGDVDTADGDSALVIEELVVGSRSSPRVATFAPAVFPSEAAAFAPCVWNGRSISAANARVCGDSVGTSDDAALVAVGKPAVAALVADCWAAAFMVAKRQPTKARAKGE